MNRKRTKKALWRKERKFKREAYQAYQITADEIVRRLQGKPNGFDLEAAWIDYKGITDADVGIFFAPYTPISTNYYYVYNGK